MARDARLAVEGRSPWDLARARWLVSSATLLLCLSFSTPAQATAIGIFNWSEYPQESCDAGLCGPFFYVGNFSTDPDISLGALGDTFFNVSVALQTDGGASSLQLGDIAPDTSSQSIDDLFGTSITFAALTLTFNVPGSIQFLDEFGNGVTGLTAPGSLLIDFAASEPPAPVPEPSTWLLLLVGLSLLPYARRTRLKPFAVRPPDPLR